MAVPDPSDGAAPAAAASPVARPAPAPPGGAPGPAPAAAPARAKPPASTRAHAQAPRAQPQLTPEQLRRREQERAEWERTRGAGTSVLALLEDTAWLRRHGMDPSVPGASPVSIDQWKAADVLPTLSQIEAAPTSEPQEVPSADALLDTGIGDYALLPKILGRGKFSTVFLSAKHGKLYAVKHTPLFPHHMLIATRLLREPTLLAELPPHPNLVAVYETIRTPGHFYLVEEYLGGYVTLEKLLMMTSTTEPPALPTLPTDIASSVFTQLVSAVDAIHTPLQVCHRDIKPENILVHPQTLQLKLLDFGLATHFSKSEAKLSTCCGSPAFHCPEIAHALSSPLGAVTYWGPEVDAWTIGVTMLRVLTGVRYPLGASHTSLRSMALRAQRALNLVADPDLRRRTGMLLEMDSIKRMQNFKQLVAEHEQAHGQSTRGSKEFKSSTFIPTTPTHRMKIPLLVDAHGEACMVPSSGPGLLSRARTSSTLSLSQVLSSNSSLSVQTPTGSRSTSPNEIPTQPPSPGEAPQHPMLILLNPDHEPPARVLSFIKYTLRCAGILYHGWPQSTPGAPGASDTASPPVDKAVADLKDEARCESDTTPTPTPAPTPPPPGTATSTTSKKKRHEEWAAVFVLECVLELPDPPPSPSGAMSFVQSIMAAFGRRSSDSNTTPGSKRSSSTPAGKDAARPNSHTPPKPSPGPSGKEGPIRCLKFHLVVRIPKMHHHHRQPQGHHQYPHATTPRAPDAPSQPTRPRHTRSASAYGARTQEPPPRPRAISFRPLLPAPQRSTLDLQMLPSGSAAWAVQPQPAPAPQQAPVAFVTAATGGNDSLSLNPMTSPTGARRPLPSPGPSMPRSRTSSRTRPVASRRRQPRIYVEITDLRAADAVVDALSLGGTQTQAQSPHEAYRATETDVSTTDAEGNDTDSGAIRAVASVLGRKKGSGTPTGTPRKGKGASLSQTSSRASEELENQRGRPREPKQGEARRDAEGTVVPSPALRAPSRSTSRQLDVKALEAELGSAELELHRALTPRPEVEGDDLGVLHLAEYRMRRLYESLERLDHKAPTQLGQVLSDRTFVIFAALTPALGAIPGPHEDTTPKTSNIVAAGPSALRTYGLKVLTTVARHSSPREVFVAVVERLEALASSETACAFKESQEDCPDGTAVLRSCPWESTLEIAGLLETLKTVLPRLQSKKPHKFTETLASTLPRAARRATTRLTAHHVSVVGPLVESVCGVCMSLAQWEADMRTPSTSERKTMAPSTSAIASPNLASLYVTTVATLLSALPDAGHLCQSYLSRPETSADANPILASSVATQRTIVPGIVPQGDGTMMAPAVPDPAAALWAQVDETTDSLHISLLTTALQPLDEDKEVDHSAARAARMAAFLLMVNLLAKGYSVAGLNPPTAWTSTSAGTLLFESRAILLAALAPHASDEAMADAGIQWVLWALKAAGKEEDSVDSTTVLTLSQRLFGHLSTPLGRPARIALRDLLAHQAGPLALDLLHDWCAPEEEGSRPAMALALARDAASAQGPPGVLWSPAARDALLPPIEALIESGLPPAPAAGASLEERQVSASSLLPALSVSSGALTEAVQWVYFYLSADPSDSAGLRAILPELRGKVYAPLHNAVFAWKAALDGIEGDEYAQAAMALDLLDLALARLLDAMEADAAPALS